MMRYSIKTILLTGILVSVFISQAQDLKLVLPTGHVNGVSWAQFSEDGKKIITSGSDGDVKVWDASNGMLLYDTTQTQQPGEAYQKNAMLYSPGKKKRASLSGDGMLRVWDGATDKKLMELPAPTFSHIAFSPDSRHLAVSSNAINGYTAVLNADNGAILFELRGRVNRLASAFFSIDGNRMLLSSFDNSARIWSTQLAAITAYFDGFNSPVLTAAFSHDNEHVVLGTMDGIVQIWQSSPARHLVTLQDSTIILSEAIFSPDKTKLLTIAMRGVYQRITMLWDTRTGRLIEDLTGKFYEYQRAIFDSNGKVMYVYRYSGIEDIYRLSKGDLTKYVSQNQDVIRSSVFSPDNKQVLLVSRYVAPNVKLWDVASGTLIRTIKLGEDAYFEDVNFNKGLVMVNRNGMIVLFDLLTGKEVYQYVPMEEGTSLSRIPSGYYQCSRDAARTLHYVTGNLDVISFDQLDVRFNRPDKVLEASGRADTALVSAYRNAYYKRIEKLGIDTSLFQNSYAPPVTRITNKDSIAYEQSNGKLTLCISNADEATPLHRFHVWVNETPVYGLKGLDISGRNSRNFDTTITLQLSAGENRVEVCVANAGAIESFRSFLVVKCNNTQLPAEKVYFVGIGIDRFADASQNLKYCTKDIRDLAEKFKTRYGSKAEIYTLFNQEVTIENVRALKQKLVNAAEDDKVIVSYSGHGLFNPRFDYYLSSYNVQFDDPTQTGISLDELEDLLDGNRSRKKLMIIDACHSGEYDKEEMQKNAAAAKRSVRPVVTNKRGIQLPASNLGLKGSYELMQELFVNTRRTTGTTIIAAAGGKQYAWEDDQAGNGVLTLSILELLKGKGTITVNQLKKHVCDEVVKITKGVQQPVARFETQYTDWDVW